MNDKTIDYAGFEQGPIRPPSEARSLLIRVTRNCPWNRCAFCPVYKGSDFSLRPVGHVIQDIETVYRHIEWLRDFAGGGVLPGAQIRAAMTQAPPGGEAAYGAALDWFLAGMKSVFLQDANSLIVRARDLCAVLDQLRARFPGIERITTYARSQTAAKKRDRDLAALRRAGLNRVHIGFESGCDEVLTRVAKGTTQAQHIEAGRKIKAAGMELSEYYMPGLGGRALARQHAIDSAHALNAINPDFIRLRTLAIPSQVPLFADYQAGRFEKCTDREAAEEILLFLDHLDGIQSYVASDHILNLFGEVEGRLPEDKPKMMGVIRRFLDLPGAEQCLFQVGRRLGIFLGLDDLASPRRRARAETACREFGITPGNADEAITTLMQRFI